MLSTLESFFSKVLDKDKKEGFEGNMFGTPAWLPMLLAALTVLVIQLLIGKFLWNGYLTRLVPAIQPVEGIIDVLAISFLGRLLFA